MARYLIGNIKGPAGEDGFSPSASVVQTNSGATITITDANGTTTANIRNGVDGDGNNIDLSPYATKEDLTIMGASISAAGYATEDYVENAVQNINIPVQSVNGMVGDVVVAIPDISDLATEDYVDAAVANVNVDLTGYATEQYVANAIADVNGFSGDYDDLTNKPDLSDMVHASDLADVALTGSFTDLLNVPDIPAAQVNADWNAAGGKAQILNKPTIPAADGTTIVNNNGVWSAVGGGSSFSGDYDDLTNKPDLSVYAEAAHLATVATTGDYDDLTDKPDLSGFATTTALTTGLAAKQDTLTAGTNITIDANNVISATGGSNYGDDDVADYISDTFGMAKTSVPSGTETYSFNNIPLTTKTLLDTAAITVPPISPVRPLAMDQVDIWGSNGLLDSISAQNWVASTGGGTPAQWEYVISPENDSSVSLTIGASSDDGHKIYLKDFTCSYADAQSYSGAFDITVPAHTEVSTLQTQFIPIDNSTIRVNSNGKLEAQSSGGSTYTAGTGIDITNDEISIDNTVALKSDIPAEELPTISSGDAGKVLTVNSGETGVEWTAPSGGGATYTAGYGINIATNNNNEISIDENVVATKSEIPVSYGDSDVSSYLQYHFGLYDGSSTTDINSPDYSVDSTGTLTITSGWTPNPNFPLEINGDDGNGNGMNVGQCELQYNDNTNLYEATMGVENYSDFTITYNENTGETILNYDWEFFNDNGLSIFHFTQWITIESYDALNDKYIPNTIARVADLEDELPDYSNASAGDVLAVDSNGDLEWTTPSGGGATYTAGNGIEIDANNVIRPIHTPSIFDIFWTSNFSLTNNGLFGAAKMANDLDWNGFVDALKAGYIVSTYNASSKDYLNGYTYELTPAILGVNQNNFAIVNLDNNPVNNTSTGGSYYPRVNKIFFFDGRILYIWTSMSRIVEWMIIQDGNNTVKLGNYIRNKQDAITAANAPTALYLKDTNNVVYEITVDTNGQLVATAVSNS